jgi:hypothetical protein
MPRKILLLFVVTLLGSAQAEGWFIGVSGAFLTDFNFVAPGVGLQVGGEVSESVAIRATLDSYFGTVFAIGTDVLYLYNLPDTPDATVYAGGGLDYVVLSGLGALPLAHGTVGLEYRTGSVGVFGELRLYIYVPNLRAGVNIHF